MYIYFQEFVKDAFQTYPLWLKLLVWTPVIAFVISFALLLRDKNFEFKEKLMYAMLDFMRYGLVSIFVIFFLVMIKNMFDF